MKTKLLTCVSTKERPGLKKLEHSLVKFNYDYQIMVEPTIDWMYGGWHNFYRWAKEQVKDPNGYTHFIYTDGFDTLALAPMDEIIKKYQMLCPNLDVFLYAAEKNCFPTCGEKGYATPELYYEKYKYEPHQKWRFLNGGQFMTPVKKFLEMYEKIDLKINSQHWGHQQFLWNNVDGRIKLDVNCEIFQSTSFRDFPNQEGDDFSIIGENEVWDDQSQVQVFANKRLFNNFTKTKPCIAHANGSGVNLEAEFQFVWDILGV